MSLLLFIHRLRVRRRWDVVRLGSWLDAVHGFPRLHMLMDMLCLG